MALITSQTTGAAAVPAALAAAQSALCAADAAPADPLSTPVRPTKHGLSSSRMALITSGLRCDAYP